MALSRARAIRINFTSCDAIISSLLSLLRRRRGRVHRVLLLLPLRRRRRHIVYYLVGALFLGQSHRERRTRLPSPTWLMYAQPAVQVRVYLGPGERGRGLVRCRNAVKVALHHSKINRDSVWRRRSLRFPRQFVFFFSFSFLLIRLNWDRQHGAAATRAYTNNACDIVLDGNK